MTDIISFEPVVARDANGLPVALATAEFFTAGTTTPVTVFADEAETSPHPIPLVADGNGVFPAVFSSGGAIKVVVKTPFGAVLYTLDPAIKVSAAGGAASTISFSATASIPSLDVQLAIEQVQTNMETTTALKAPLASPALTGTPTAPTAATATDTTQLATTAFVQAQVLDEDDFVTDSATRPPSQQSTKAYVDTAVATVVGFSATAVYTDVTASHVVNVGKQNTASTLMLVSGETLNLGAWEVSPDNTTWTIANKTTGSDRHMSNFIVLPGWWYKSTSFADISSVIEFV